MYNALTKRDPQSIALLMSMGGIPGGKNENDDATFADVKAEAKSTAAEYKNAAKKINFSLCPISFYL